MPSTIPGIDIDEKNNIWGINVDDGYHEEGVIERSVPTQNN